MRGNRVLATRHTRCSRSIPASAGQPAVNSVTPGVGEVYPRECGATGSWLLVILGAHGLSPRVRGNRCHHKLIPGRHRSIPASAGQPDAVSHGDSPLAVYPRECGATYGLFWGAVQGSGLSPRVRGNRRQDGVVKGRAGSIPASAGQPREPSVASRWVWVYPRECGATMLILRVFQEGQGLSPRVRGNLLDGVSCRPL